MGGLAEGADLYVLGPLDRPGEVALGDDSQNGAAMLRSYMAVLNSMLNKVEARQLFATGYLDHDPLPGQAVGVEGIAQLCDLLGGRSVRFAAHLEAHVADHGLIAFRWFGTGEAERQTFQLMELPRLFTAECIGMFRLANGKLAERWGPIRVLGL